MLRQRVITSVVALVVVGVFLFVVQPAYTEIAIGLLILAGAWEWAGFFEADSLVVRAIYVTIVGACLAAVYFIAPGLSGAILKIAVAWWLLAFIWTLFYPTSIPRPVRWVCGLLVLVPLFVALLLLFRHGVEYLLFTLFIVWAADAGAYFAGKQFGRVKLAPAISPGKTWEGVIGGLVLVAALAVGVGLWRGLEVAVFLPFVLAVAAISVVGDLTVSMFKRTAGVKDSGRLFPGHGGVLDRIDSVSAAAPLFALGLGWLGLV